MARVLVEPTNRLADGVLVEARVRARIFGAPILRVDAEVVLAPARADLPGSGGTDVVAVSAADVPAIASAADRQPLPLSTRVRPGSALAQASTLLEQSERSLRATNWGPDQR